MRSRAATVTQDRIILNLSAWLVNIRRVISLLSSGGPHCSFREIGQPRPHHTPALQMIKRDNQNTKFTIITQNLPTKSRSITFEMLLTQPTIYVSPLDCVTLDMFVPFLLYSSPHCRPIQVLWFLASRSRPVWRRTAPTIGTRTGPKQQLMLPPHR